jgi:ABC-type tungstate transport system substrate-binding protein
MILADTPWTFPFWFAWMLLSVLAPFVFLAAAVLATFRVTRRIGLAMLIGGVIGSLCGVRRVDPYDSRA